MKNVGNEHLSKGSCSLFLYSNRLYLSTTGCDKCEVAVLATSWTIF